MGVGFASYEIARSGLSVNERGLYVTGHNISNVNTPGYVRQQAMIATGPYKTEFTRNGLLQYGLGADIQGIRQIRHTFLDSIYRQENTTLGYWEARNKTFQDVEAILAEPMGSGFQNVMNQFWDSWQELSKEPDSLTVRALVRQRGEAVVQHVNHLGAQLDRLQNDLNSEINVRIEEVNEITAQIAKLNVEILKTEVTGDSANDFRDQRNTLVDRLSKLVDADVTEMQDGQMVITLGGYYLVDKGLHTRLYPGERKPGEMFNVPKLEGTNIEVSLKSGIIKGLLESRGEIPGFKGSIANGTPNTKADITFVIDNSSDASAVEDLDKIKASVLSYVEELKKKGIDFNLRLVTYSDTASTNTMVWTKANIDTAGSSFAEAVNAITTDTGTGASENNFDDAIGELTSISYREDANRYAVVFSGESVGGNEADVDNAELQGYINSLKSGDIKTFVVTDPAYFDAGDPDAGGAGIAAGWGSITEATGGGLLDINASDFNALMKEVNDEINEDVNREISFVEQSNNILSDLKKRMNAIVNILVREVNYLQMSGKTLDGNAGTEFFVPIDDAYPMGMGNIRLNPNLSDLQGLNNIVASRTGAAGDNTIALEMANLRHASLLTDASGILSLDNYYQAVIMNVGRYGSDAANITSSQQKLVQSADSYRQSITGVSMDEEMTNMMKYKFAYDASSRALNVIDQMMETIITQMGIVGR